MDVIEFRIAVEDGEGKVAPGLTIHPVMNGVALKDLAKPVEQQFADAEGNPDQAGDYMASSRSTICAGPLSTISATPSTRGSTTEIQRSWAASAVSPAAGR